MGNRSTTTGQKAETYEIEIDGEKLTVTVEEMQLEPITEPLPPLTRYTGLVADKLHYDRFCDCGVYYENQITVPKRHSLICFCPKCGCVTQD